VAVVTTLSSLTFEPIRRLSSYTAMMTGGEVAVGAPLSCNGAAVVSTYFVGVDFATGRGARYSGLNQGGVLFQANQVIRVTQSGAPNGATPIW